MQYHAEMKKLMNAAPATFGFFLLTTHLKSIKNIEPFYV
jgi:hypothetical protein